MYKRCKVGKNTSITLFFNEIKDLRKERTVVKIYKQKTFIYQCIKRRKKGYSFTKVNRLGVKIIWIRLKNNLQIYLTQSEQFY